MSPVMRAVPRRAPSSRFGRSLADAGMSWATGSPKRVTSTGFPVLRTLSRTARQVALNFEMAISSMGPYYFKSYYGQRPWSILTQKIEPRPVSLT